MARMHPDQVDVDVELVRQLLAAQFPQWSELPISRVRESGTDHALFRLGERLLARMPIVGWAVDQAASDQRWLPYLAPHLPLEIPSPLAVGEPGASYPHPWLVVRWIPGDTPRDRNLDMRRAAVNLSGFVRSLHGVDPAGGPVKTDTMRGVPLANLDAGIRETIAALGDEIDQAAVTRAWDDAVSAPAWTHSPRWIHGDLQRGNLLVRDRRIVAVIDFGGLGLGDPAPDLAPAWNLLGRTARAAFLEAAGYDAATRARGKGWVLAPALQGIGYYRDTRPDLAAAARQNVAAVVADS